MAVAAQVHDIRSCMSLVNFPDLVVFELPAEEGVERFDVEVGPVAVLTDRLCCMEVVLLGQSRKIRLDHVVD